MLPLRTLLNDAFHFYKRNLGQIFTLCMPFLLAGAVMNYIITGSGASGEFSTNKFFVSMAVEMALYPMYAGSLILMMAAQAANRLPTNAELLSSSLSIYPQLLLLGVAWRAMAMMGFFFLVLPGIWVSVRMAFAEFFLVVERLDPHGAIVRSFQTTRPHFFLILSALALIALPVFMLTVLTGSTLYNLKAPAFIQIGVEALIAFLALILHVVMFRIFMEARHNRSTEAGL